MFNFKIDRLFFYALFWISLLAPNLSAEENLKGSKNQFDLISLIQAQGVAYSHNDWNHFFGAAQVYRKTRWEQYPSVTLISLEILALLRFCHYYEALQIAQGLERWAETRKNDDPKTYASVYRIISLARSFNVGTFSLQSHPITADLSRKPNARSLPITEKAFQFFLPTQFSSPVISRCSSS